MPLSVSTCHTRTTTQPQPWSLPATPTGWSNRLAWESCLSDKHHIRSPRFQCAFITIIRVSANSVVHCQITTISISILINLSNLNADATPLAATAILDLRSTQSWFSKSYMQEKCRAINSQIFDMYGLHEVIHRLSSALNQLKLENPGRRFPILINLITNQNRSRCRGAEFGAHLCNASDCWRQGSVWNCNWNTVNGVVCYENLL